MGATFGYHYRFTDRDGTVTAGDGEGFPSHTEAMASMERCLRGFGWTPPKWWQWWRWSDYPREWPIKALCRNS